ncbi:MAG TPA: hypothetical protein VNO81_04335, partial [Candidatus Nitrosotenuis sp.]|nr:hypothetical protein [Candidatus Nitrosotenuis sp.]
MRSWSSTPPKETAESDPQGRRRAGATIDPPGGLLAKGAPGSGPKWVPCGRLRWPKVKEPPPLAILLALVLLAAGLAGCTVGDKASNFTQGRSNPVDIFTWAEMGPRPQFDAQSTHFGVGTNFNVSGRANAVLAFGDPQVLVLATASGGIWRSEDGGTTWTPTTDRLLDGQVPGVQNFGALAIDAQGVLWAGSGEANYSGDSRYGAGIFRSQDGGQTWSPLTGPGGERLETFDRMAVSALAVGDDSQTLFVATTSGAFGGAREFGLYRSINGGQSFINVLEQTAQVDDVVFSQNGQRVLAALNRTGVLFSDQNGDPGSFQSANGLPLVDFSAIKLAVAPSNASVVYALVSDGSGSGWQGLYGSGDGGANFVPVVDGATLAASIGGQSFYNNSLAVQSDDASTVYCGAVEMARVEGIDPVAGTFTAIVPLTNGQESHSPHVDHHFLTFTPQGDLLSCNDGGLFLLPDPAGAPAFSPETSTWRPLNGDSNLGQALGTIQLTGVSLHPDSIQVALGGSQDNDTGLFRGVQNWVGLGPAADGGFPIIDPGDGQVLYITNQYPRSGSSSWMVRSLDGGKTLQTDVNEGIDFSLPGSFYPPFTRVRPNQASSSLSRLCMANQAVFETVKNDASGVLWAQSSAPLVTGRETLTSLAYAPGQPGVLYAGSSAGKVFARLQDGADFTPGQGLPEATVWGLAVHPADPATALACLAAFDTGHVFRTQDGGQTWQDISSDLPNVPHYDAVIVADVPSQPVYFVSNDLGVYFSTDQGASWSPFGTGLPVVPVVDLERATYGPVSVLAAGTHGRGMWEVSLNPGVQLSAAPAGGP